MLFSSQATLEWKKWVFYKSTQFQHGNSSLLLEGCWGMFENKLWGHMMVLGMTDEIIFSEWIKNVGCIQIWLNTTGKHAGFIGSTTSGPFQTRPFEN